MSARGVALRLVAVVMVLACTSDLPVGPGRVMSSAYGGTSESGDCAIMIAALDSFALNGKAASLVLDDSTSPIAVEPLPDYTDGYRRWMIDSLDLDPAVWDDFVRRNETSVPLCAGIRDRLAVSATSLDSIRGARGDSANPLDGLERGTWPNIVYHYVVSVTRAGVSSDGRQALISLSSWCGGLCGSGWLMVLERDDDHWRVRGMLMTWVS